VAITVLIVDDHPSFRRLANRMLDAAGFAVIGEAEDGSSALAAVARLRPDVVLLDVVLPDRSGLTVAEQLIREADPPRVVLTSSRSRSTLARGSSGPGTASSYPNTGSPGRC